MDFSLFFYLLLLLLSFDNFRYSTHMRDEAEHLLEAVDEALKIGSTSRVPVVISHHKAHGKKNFGKVG